MKLRITVQGVRYDVDVEVLDLDSPTNVSLEKNDGGHSVAANANAKGSGEITSPIAGTVFDIRVKPGDVVKVNDTLVVLEAMKMESNIASTHAGIVQEVCVQVGDSVTHGQALVHVA